MKKSWIIAAALLLLVRVEHTGTDISDLEPVALICVTQEAGTVHVATDTGAEGTGQSLSKAITDLHAGASAVVFLDTAEYLLLNEEATQLLPQLYELLRPACQVAVVEGEPDLQEAAEFLKAHPPETKLLHCRAGEAELPTLYYEEGRGRLEQGNRQ